MNRMEFRIGNDLFSAATPPGFVLWLFNVALKTALAETKPKPTLIRVVDENF